MTTATKEFLQLMRTTLTAGSHLARICKDGPGAPKRSPLMTVAEAALHFNVSLQKIIGAFRKNPETAPKPKGQKKVAYYSKQELLDFLTPLI